MKPTSHIKRIRVRAGKSHVFSCPDCALSHRVFVTEEADGMLWAEWAIDDRATANARRGKGMLDRIRQLCMDIAKK